MKLAVSNIAWNAGEQGAVLDALRAGGVQGVEVAPTKYWPDWNGATPDAALKTKQALASEGFAVPSFQAVLFGKPDLKVFGTADEQRALYDHMERVAELAAAMGARVLVFGSPKNRDPGALEPQEAMARGVDAFREMGARCAAHGVVVGVEANPSEYGCRFMTGWRDAAQLVRACDHPGVRLHLDAACTKMAGDDIAEATRDSADILAHAHISEPQLGGFDAPQSDHAAFGAALKEIGYGGWASIEMRRADNPVPAIMTALDVARTHYG